MARRGRPKRIVELTVEQREELARWTRRTTTAAGLALRARIILACVEGGDDYDVAVRHGTTSLFAALDVKTGRVIGECHRRHRARCGAAHTTARASAAKGNRRARLGSAAIR
jgi:hypothetical protein